MRLHRISYHAGWKVIKPQFYDYLKESNEKLYRDIISLSDDQLFKALSVCIHNEEFSKELDAFINTKKMDKNSSYMWNLHQCWMFQDLMDGIYCQNPTDQDIAKLETFMCRLYKDRTASSLNTVRVRTFLTCNKPEEMPPTSNYVPYPVSLFTGFHMVQCPCYVFGRTVIRVDL